MFAALFPLLLADPRMTSASWVFLGLGWLAVGLLTFWCFRRVLGGGGPGSR